MRSCFEYFRRAPRVQSEASTTTILEKQATPDSDELPSYHDLFGDTESPAYDSRAEPIKKAFEEQPVVKADAVASLPWKCEDKKTAECPHNLKNWSLRQRPDDSNLAKLAITCYGCRIRARVARAYIRQTEISHGRYLRTIQATKSVFDFNSALSLSLEQVRKINSDAAQLFLFFAYFHFDDLSYSLIASTDVVQTSWISRVTCSPEEYRKTMTCLENYGLVESSDDTYRIEQPIHEWLFRTLKAGPVFSTFTIALRCVAFSCNSISSVNNDHQPNRFVQHADHLMSPTFERMWHFAMQDPNSIEAIVALARCYQQWNQPEKATALSEPILTARQRKQTPALSLTAGAMSNLAKTLAKQGQKQEAMHLYKQALDIFDADPKTNHALHLKTLRRLGCLHGTLGNLKEADIILKKVLNTALFPPCEHRDVAMIVRAHADLGICRYEQQRFSEALALYRLALDDYEHILERDHPTIMLVYLRLGDTHNRLSQHEQANAAYARVLLGYTRRHGEHHRKTVNLTDFLRSMRERREIAEHRRNTEIKLGFPRLEEDQRQWEVLPNPVPEGIRWCGFRSEPLSGERTCESSRSAILSGIH